MVEINHVTSGSASGAGKNDAAAEGAGAGNVVNEGVIDPFGEKADFPDSSIGEGMDISIQGANGHVKTTGANAGGESNGKSRETASLRSQDSNHQLQVPVGGGKGPASGSPASH